jgi:hypothetical protein
MRPRQQRAFRIALGVVLFAMLALPSAAKPKQENPHRDRSSKPAVTATDTDTATMSESSTIAATLDSQPETVNLPANPKKSESGFLRSMVEDLLQGLSADNESFASPSLPPGQGGEIPGKPDDRPPTPPGQGGTPPGQPSDRPPGHSHSGGNE